MANKPTIVGIGSASRKILNYIYKYEPDLKFLCIDRRELKNPKNDNFLRFFKPDLKVCESKAGCGITRSLTRNRSQKDEENLKKSDIKTLSFKDFASIGRALNGENNIVVILPLGGNFGNDMGQYIIRYLISQNKDISVIATTPFKFEGKNKLQESKNSLAQIEEIVFDTTVFNNNSLLDKLDTQVSLPDAFRIIDEILYDTLKEKFL